MRVSVLVAAAVVVAGIPHGRPGAQPPVFDLVLVNGRVADGSGAPLVAADLAIRDGRIVRVGRVTGTARERLDVAGLVVAPGFIDVHTHADGLAGRPGAENFVRMGVTTIVAGNCGSSAEAIGESLDRLRDTGIAPNYATLIGHNTVRALVMGTERRDPSPAELQRMKTLVFQAMAEGAVGLSTGLQYVPGAYAKSNEIVELARVAANEGGLYATHMRNEGTALLAALDESIRVAETVGMRLEISHLKVDSPAQWGTAAAALGLIDRARARGVRVLADQYAYTAGSSGLSIRFPSWVLEGGQARIRERLTSEVEWARIEAEMRGLLAERGFSDLSWATVASYAADPSLNGLSMTAVAERLVGSASAEAQLEAARRMMLAGGASMVYHFMQDDDVAAIMRHPIVAIASDAGLIAPGQGAPHPRGYGNTARVLGEFVRDRRVLTIEAAVRKMTSLPAEHFGFAGRGVIREGAAADLVVFDPARVGDRSTYAAPHASPDGIAHVIVNGTFVVRGGQPTAARPGIVLRNRARGQ
jgi:N-acyl-D-amino-acid deacylase